MKTLLAGLVLGLSVSAFAATDVCTLQYNQTGSTLGWTAFKTPKKVGVKGQFTNFSIKTEKSDNIDTFLKSMTVEVNTDSVSTNDKARDVKIFQFFFKSMNKGTKITGKVLKVDDIKAEVEFTLNGQTKMVVMGKQYDAAKNTLTLTGALNVLDFGMKENLSKLTKACAALHENVTWPDVNIELVASITKSCK